VAELHLWNEQLPRMNARGADVAWGRAFWVGWVYSLRLVAAYVEAEPRYRAVSVLRAETSATAQDLPAAERFARMAGFQYRLLPPPHGAWEHFVGFWEGFYAWMLIWTFNPASLRGKSMRSLRRYQLWISRPALLKRYL
jgi:hypothetical protein